jgi:4-amino-4-deoxy-L-arabinose transferase-like glycosyltransferase
MKTEHFKKLGINIAVLFLFGVLVWLGYRLFTHSFGIGPIIGVVIFIVCVAGWILLIRLMESRKYRWVRPSLKLTTFCIIAVILVLSFAGVQPLSNYKDAVISKAASYLHSAGSSASKPAAPFPYGTYVIAGDPLGEGIIFYADGTYKAALLAYAVGIEAGTYSVSDRFITFVDELTSKTVTVEYKYSNASQWLYLYLPSLFQIPGYPTEIDTVIFVKQ